MIEEGNLSVADKRLVESIDELGHSLPDALKEKVPAHDPSWSHAMLESPATIPPAPVMTGAEAKQERNEEPVQIRIDGPVAQPQMQNQGDRLFQSWVNELSVPTPPTVGSQPPWFPEFDTARGGEAVTPEWSGIISERPPVIEDNPQQPPLAASGPLADYRLSPPLAASGPLAEALLPEIPKTRAAAFAPAPPMTSSATPVPQRSPTSDSRGAEPDGGDSESNAPHETENRGRGRSMVSYAEPAYSQLPSIVATRSMSPRPQAPMSSPWSTGRPNIG